MTQENRPLRAGLHFGQGVPQADSARRVGVIRQVISRWAGRLERRERAAPRRPGSPGRAAPRWRYSSSRSGAIVSRMCASVSSGLQSSMKRNANPLM